MRRLFFLLPEVESARSVVKELRTLGVPESHMHAVSSIAKPLHGLPKAGVWQTTELAHGLEWGLGLGITAGFIGVWLAMKFQPGGLHIGGEALAIGALAGGLFGALVSALMKSDEHNHELNDYQAEIERGEILLIVDVPLAHLETMQKAILKHHSEARIKVADPSAR